MTDDSRYGARAVEPDNRAMFGWIGSHPFAYPLLEAVHIVGIALLLGSLLLFELRWWGAAAAAVPLDALARLALPASAAGFGIATLTGLAMFASQPGELLNNRAFALKMVLLMAAGTNAALFHARGGLARRDGVAHLQTALSLVLWLGVLGCGRAIAYI